MSSANSINYKPGVMVSVFGSGALGSGAVDRGLYPRPCQTKDY